MKLVVASIAATVAVVLVVCTNHFRPRVPIHIDKETTRLTGPLRGNGTVDYAAALRRKTMKAVTTENNAAVIVRQALGPEQDRSELPQWYYNQLHVNPPPPDGDYFISLSRIISEKYPNDSDYSNRKLNDVKDLVEEAMSRPWTGEEFPFVTEWLDRNQVALTRALEASQRNRFASLAIPPGESLLVTRTWDQWAVRELAKLIALQIMRSVADGQFEEAWQNARACHRLARLVDQGPIEFDGLIAHDIESTALICDIAIATHSHFPAERLRACRHRVRQLSVLSPMLDRIDGYVRLMVLDMICRLAHGEIDLGLQDPWWLKVPLATRAYDWNVALRHCNQRFDELVATWDLPTREERHEAQLLVVERIRNSVHQLKKDEISVWIAAMLGTDTIPRFTADFALNATVSSALDLMAAEERVAVRRQLALTAFSIAAFRVVRGRFPDNLEELVPEYVESVPSDPYSESNLVYTQTESGYELLSVGPNGVDDTAWNLSEMTDSGDDVVVRGSR